MKLWEDVDHSIKQTRALLHKTASIDFSNDFDPPEAVMKNLKRVGSSLGVIAENRVQPWLTAIKNEIDKCYIYESPISMAFYHDLKYVLHGILICYGAELKNSNYAVKLFQILKEDLDYD